MKIICVVPVYNEQNKLLTLIKKIKKYKKKQKIDFIFFNNGSTDKSRNILVKEKQKFIEENINKRSQIPNLNEVEGFATKS